MPSPPTARHLPKPADMFDRDWEWSELTAFATGRGAGPRLGVVSGRRRQGKSFLLQALAEATGGFYYAAVEASVTESLQLLGEAVARYTGASLPPRPAHWEEALDLLFSLAAAQPLPVIIDEFPYLVRNAPALPSQLQAAIGVRSGRHLERHPRILLCGSAMSFMGGLLSGTSPLYGRAGLDLVVHSLGYREAAEFWGIDDPELAVLTHAVVGGTPAYRREFVDDDVPAGRDDFDDWVCRTVLNPARPIHGEASFLLAAEPDMRDRALYHSVLAAVAGGNHTSGGIASAVGRKATDISLPLTVLRNCGLLTAQPDAFRRNRTTYHVAEPLIAFHHAVVRPESAVLSRRRGAAQVWSRSRAVFLSKVVGPHFEGLCREWVEWHADPETFGGMPIQVSAGTVADPAARTSHEVDVVVHGAVGQDHGILLSVGEVKWHKVMDLRHLERLRHILALLAARGVDTSHARPACYSGAGFTHELRAAAGRGEVVLVDLNRLYRGS
ncbi:ATP-binding protein [Streptomyces sp. S07_1.15]|uniref:AAA family ATPase n=1 Tax=Streptomyces sp. S07_1.15 TaxID=2873925 RepID=UPI001D146F79|nr:ATP-binding protein [Streptomyces sp. S07_1.15]MCC3655389.1 ATP-binding protein [Streptomyces sp. S07_1.15]